MAKVLKSVNFESDNSVAISATRFASDPPPPSPANHSDSAEPTASTNQAETQILLAEAQTHVEMMLSQARLQVDTLRQEAKQAGWDAGYAEARQAAEAELAELMTTARAVVQEAITVKHQFLRDSQPEFGRLAVAIAEKILGKELTLNSKAITDIVARAIEAANVQGACYIKVNPQDYEILGPLWDAIPSFQQPGDSWELVADRRISRGGCLIEVGGGTVDARWETQLAQISAAFEASGNSGSAETS